MLVSGNGGTLNWHSTTVLGGVMAGLIETPSKPVPVPDEASRPFFDGARRGVLLLRRCGDCGTFMSPTGGLGTPLRPRCVGCFSADLEWAPAGGRGTLYSFALMHQVYDPAFADEVPYNIAVVELDEGVRMTTNVVGCANEELWIGMPLEVTFEQRLRGSRHPQVQEVDVTDMASHPETVGRDLGGCPVMHRDFAPEQAAGCHWELADELRETSPVYFNTFAQGYWIFTRHDAVTTSTRRPDLFSSESITPWEPEPIYRFVPTQIDAPDHIKYRRILNPWFSPRRDGRGRADDRARSAGGSSRRRRRRAAATSSRSSRCASRPRRSSASSASTPPTPTCSSPWVEDFFAGFGGDPAGLEAMASALDGIREYWVAALDERRGEAGAAEGDLASHLLHATFDDERPLTDDRDARHAAPCWCWPGSTRRAPSSATCSGTWPRIPSTAAGSSTSRS